MGAGECYSKASGSFELARHTRKRRGSREDEVFGIVFVMLCFYVGALAADCASRTIESLARRRDNSSRRNVVCMSWQLCLRRPRSCTCDGSWGRHRQHALKHVASEADSSVPVNRQAGVPSAACATRRLRNEHTRYCQRLSGKVSDGGIRTQYRASGLCSACWARWCPVTDGASAYRRPVALAKTRCARLCVPRITAVVCRSHGTTIVGTSSTKVRHAPSLAKRTTSAGSGDRLAAKDYIMR